MFSGNHKFGAGIEIFPLKMFFNATKGSVKGVHVTCFNKKLCLLSYIKGKFLLALR